MTDDVQSEAGTDGTPDGDVGRGGLPGSPPWKPPSVDDGFSPGPLGVGEPLSVPEESTPLEEDEPEGTIPPCPLWAMKDRRHVQWSAIAGFPPERIREAFGGGDDTVYAIEDGHHHVIVGRNVGQVGDGSQYALVGRAPLSAFESLRGGQLKPQNAFDDADQIALCGVDIDDRDKASDIFVVAFYGDASAVPAEYLPGHPPLRLLEPLPVAGL